MNRRHFLAATAATTALASTTSAPGPPVRSAQGDRPPDDVLRRSTT